MLPIRHVVYLLYTYIPSRLCLTGVDRVHGPLPVTILTNLRSSPSLRSVSSYASFCSWYFSPRFHIRSLHKFMLSFATYIIFRSKHLPLYPRHYIISHTTALSPYSTGVSDILSQRWIPHIPRNAHFPYSIHLTFMLIMPHQTLTTIH